MTAKGLDTTPGRSAAFLLVLVVIKRPTRAAKSNNGQGREGVELLGLRTVTEAGGGPLVGLGSGSLVEPMWVISKTPFQA